MARYDRSYGAGFGPGAGAGGMRRPRGFGGYGPQADLGRGRPLPRYAGEYANHPGSYHPTGRGYDTPLRGYGPGMGGRGYDARFARQPFMPEAAYLRHPEYDRPPTYHQYGWEGRGRYRIQDPEEMTDEEIRQEVRQRLYQDSWVDADRIEVEVNDGVVTLKGEVEDFMEARYAWDDAWESEGVRGVLNHLAVRTDVPQDHPHGDVLPQDGE